MAKKRAILGKPARTAALPEEKRSANLNVFRSAIPWAMLFGVTLAAYGPALQGKLLWDDDSHVTRPELQSWHGLWQIWFHVGATQQYYPLLHSAFWVEHRLWGDAVLGYHLTNVLLHVTCACLVVLIVRRLSLPGAWLAGFVFALHPVCVEAVAWISEQKSTLSGLFYLASALVYLQYDQSRRVSRYLLAAGLFVLALLSKTVTATLPAALLVLFWWRRGKIEWKRDVLPLLPWFAAGAAAGLFTAWVERTYIGAAGTLTLLDRCLLAARAVWFYAAKLLWPATLIFSYPRWNIDPGEWWQYLFPAGLAAVALGLGLIARRRRGPLAAFLIFTGTLFPALGFFDVYPFRYSYVADHFQYLASLGLIVPVVSMLTVAARRMLSAAPARMLSAGLLAAVLGALTWSQSDIYRDAETLYRETLAHNPDSSLAHNNLGNLLQPMPGRLPEAIAELQAAVRLAPDSESTHSNLGSALAQAGRFQEAAFQLETALRINPAYAKAHNNLGGVLSQMPGERPRAIAEFQAALRADPDSAEAHFNLGTLFSQMPGRLPDAVAQYEAAIRIEPDYLSAHTNLGDVWEQTPGRLPDAIAEFQAAVRIDPNFAEGHYNLASALEQLPGHLPDAIAEYEAAIRLRPDYLAAHIDLGGALAQYPGRMADAAAEFQAAVRLDPNFAEARYNLGNALAQIPGREAEAMVEFEAALRIKPDFAPAREALQQLRRIER